MSSLPPLARFAAATDGQTADLLIEIGIARAAVKGALGKALALFRFETRLGNP
jgi:hypothetical protein